MRMRRTHPTVPHTARLSLSRTQYRSPALPCTEHASIREEWKELRIIRDEDKTVEQESTMDDPEDVEEDTREEEGVNYNTDEEEEIPDHRRDENNEY